MKKQIILIIATVLIISSCMSVDSSVRKDVLIQKDESNPDDTFFLGSEKSLNDIQNTYCIHSVVRDKNVEHQVYCDYSYSGNWHFFKSATDVNGLDMKFSILDTEANETQSGTVLRETFYVSVSDDYLNDNSEGFELQVLATSGKVLNLRVTSDQILKQIRAIESYNS